ncbi:MAG: tetratricopeptide repeat protein [Methanomassiliicoccales archaeon]
MNCEVCGKATRQAARLCPVCSASLPLDPFAGGAFDPQADLRLAQRGSAFMRLGQSSLGEVGLSKGVDPGRALLEGGLQGDALAVAAVTLLESAGIEADLFGDEQPPARATLTQLAEISPEQLQGGAAARAALLLANLHVIWVRQLATLRLDPEVQTRLLERERSTAELLYRRAAAEPSLRTVAKEDEAMLHHLFGKGDEAVEELRSLLPAKAACFKMARVLMENGRCDEAVELLDQVPLESRDARWTRLHREGEGL